MNVRRGIAIFVACVLVAPFSVVYAAVSLNVDSQITEKQQEIDAINKKIADLTVKRAKTVGEAEAIALALEQLKAELAKADAQLKKTNATITVVQVKGKDTAAQVDALQKDIDTKRGELHSLLRQLYQFEQESFVRIFFDSQSLSDIMNQRNAYQSLQERAVAIISEMHAREADLQKQKETLDQQALDLEQLQTLLDAQSQELAQKKADQKKFLQAKQQQQAQYEGLLAEAQQAREEIKKQIFTLQSGSIKVSLQSATDMAKFAGSATGVRPALIMAVLKIESNVGTNLGNGVFPDDMQPQSREPFLRITKKLGLDPTKAQISRRPRNMKGWGGAMGPAQIMPATWEGIETRIAQLMKKPLANPYELADAFMATGIFLSDRGAQNPAMEYEAVNRYFAGPNWQYYTWYGDKVLAVAKEYASQGL